jgi:hypothetical protein
MLEEISSNIMESLGRLGRIQQISRWEGVRILANQGGKRINIYPREWSTG